MNMKEMLEQLQHEIELIDTKLEELETSYLAEKEEVDKRYHDKKSLLAEQKTTTAEKIRFFFEIIRSNQAAFDKLCESIQGESAALLEFAEDCGLEPPAQLQTDEESSEEALQTGT